MCIWTSFLKEEGGSPQIGTEEVQSQDVSSSHSRASHRLDFPRGAGRGSEGAVPLQPTEGERGGFLLGQRLVTPDMIVCYLPKVFRKVHRLLSTENMVKWTMLFLGIKRRVFTLWDTKFTCSVIAASLW